MRHEIEFWLTVAIVSIVAMALFKYLAAGALGAKVPGIRHLAGSI